MSTTFVIKRDSDGRPTEGGLRLPGQDASDQPDQSAKPMILKSGLRQTSEGRITKPSNSARNRKRHGITSISKVPASKARGLQRPSSKKSDEGSLHGISSLDKSLARQFIPEAPKTPVPEPSMEPIATEFFGFNPNDPSKSHGGFPNKFRDDVQSNANAAPTTIQHTRTPDSVQQGITNGHSHCSNAILPGIPDEKTVVSHSEFGHDESQGSHRDESAPPATDRDSFLEPAAASVGM